MGVVLHRLADDVRHLRVAAVVHPVHRVEHAALDGLQAVHDVRNRPLEDHIGGVIQEPVLEHAGKLVLPAVAAEEPREFPAFLGPFRKGLFLFLEGFFPDVVPLFTHSRSWF